MCRMLGAARCVERRRPRAALASGALVMLLGACSPASAPAPVASAELPDPAIVADSASERVISPGVVQRHYFFARGPWRVDVLDVDRAACWTTVAVKGGDIAAGRRTTSSLADSLARRNEVAGAVNADFFLFAPPGVPTNLHVESWGMLTSPNAQPVFATRGDQRTPWMGVVAMRAHVRVAGDSIPVQSFNRLARGGVALLTNAYGFGADSLSGFVVVRLRNAAWTTTPDAGRAVVTPDTRWTVIGVDTSTASDSIERGSRIIIRDSSPLLPLYSALLVAGPSAPPESRARLARLRAGADTIATVGFTTSALTPSDIRDAVGGRPILVRDSAEVAGLDTVGGASFGPFRHPRTAVGVAANGRRVFLLTVDGRRPGWSAGMTLREMASLMLSLGATQAINLDGGGSTALVVRDAVGGFRPANRPSDPTGERPVANALAVVRDSACVRAR